MSVPLWVYVEQNPDSSITIYHFSIANYEVLTHL